MYKKNLYIILICLLLFISTVHAASVKVSVPEELEGDIVTITYKEKGNIVVFIPEFYNKGSVAYKTRIRLDIYRNKSLIFTGWSSERIFAPGNKKSFKLYWFAPENGNYTVKPYIYFANNIQKEEDINVSINNSAVRTDLFSIDNIEIFYKKIFLQTNAKFIIPYSYPQGWIFESAESEGGKIVLGYEPTVWSENQITVFAVSDDGKMYTEKNIELTRRTDWLYFLINIFFMISDYMRTGLLML